MGEGKARDPAGIAAGLDREIDLSRGQIATLSALIFVPLIALALAIGVSQFSPDSWSYFELSKTVFSDRFYAFATYRSYVSDTYSASFPLGYPVTLAAAGAVFGSTPWLAVAVNLAASLAHYGRRVLLPIRRVSLGTPARPVRWSPTGCRWHPGRSGSACRKSWRSRHAASSGRGRRRSAFRSSASASAVRQLEYDESLTRAGSAGRARPAARRP